MLTGHKRKLSELAASEDGAQLRMHIEHRFASGARESLARHPRWTMYAASAGGTMYRLGGSSNRPRSMQAPRNERNVLSYFTVSSGTTRHNVPFNKVVWECWRGDIPADHTLVHQDGQYANCALDNMRLRRLAHTTPAVVDEWTQLAALPACVAVPDEVFGTLERTVLLPILATPSTYTPPFMHDGDGPLYSVRPSVGAPPALFVTFGVGLSQTKIWSRTELEEADKLSRQPKPLQACVTASGYSVCSACTPTKYYSTLQAHRIVAAAALGVAYSELQGIHVDHVNGEGFRTAKSSYQRQDLQLISAREHARKTAAKSPNASAQGAVTRGRPVIQFKDGREVARFPSARAAERALRQQSIYACQSGISQCCRPTGGNRTAYGYTWAYDCSTQSNEIRTRLAYASEFRPAFAPDGVGKVVALPGYSLTASLVLRTPSGHLTVGTRTGDGKYHSAGIRKTEYLTHRLGIATFVGPQPSEQENEVLHGAHPTAYTHPNALELRWGTHRQNICEARGRQVVVTDHDKLVIGTYESIKAAAAAHGLHATSLGSALRKNPAGTMQTHQGVQFTIHNSTV
jgi:hypothetical protein